MLSPEEIAQALAAAEDATAYATTRETRFLSEHAAPFARLEVLLREACAAPPEGLVDQCAAVLALAPAPLVEAGSASYVGLVLALARRCLEAAEGSAAREPSERVACAECGASILLATARRNAGRCAPCAKGKRRSAPQAAPLTPRTRFALPAHLFDADHSPSAARLDLDDEQGSRLLTTLLRGRFTGREALYLEKGVLRVSVVDVEAHLRGRWAKAVVEEVPTPGLPRSLFARLGPIEAGPLRWSLTSGYLTAVSRTQWTVGYGGWSLFFAAEAVEGVVRLAAGWPPALDAHARYDEVVHWLVDHGAYHEPTQRLFPD